MKPLIPPPQPFLRAAMLLVVSMLAFPMLALPATAQSCLSASQTRSAIASGEVVQLSRITAAARSNGYSQIGSASVCGSPGSYVYVVVASTSNGSSARLTFNAASGALLSSQ
ncbi:MAG: hypothetical protein AB8B88_03680 [Devosiaceae bacterium]